MVKKYFIKGLKTVLPLLLGVYLIWHSFSSLSPKDEIQFYKAIKEANYFWIIAALVFSVIALFSRAHRWKLALEPIGYKTKFWHRYHAIMIGYLINYTIPRAGEASRAAMLYKSDEIPFTTSFGTIIAERAVDFIVLASLGLLTAFMSYDDFFELIGQIKEFDFGSNDSSNTSSIPWKTIITSILFILALTGGFLFIKSKKLRDKVLQFTKEVISGLFSIFKLDNPKGYVLHTLIIWISYLLMFSLPFYCLEETSNFPISGILLGFIAGSIGIILTNGGIGTYPILVGIVVAFYLGKDHPEHAFAIGTALGWIIWLSQTLLMIILGLISLVLIPNNFSKENE
jgi:glycosyltransferase 2 family protein